MPGRSATATITEQVPGQLVAAIFAATPDAVVVVDTDGVIVLSSPAVLDLFGYYPEELVGVSLAMLLPERRREVHAGHLGGFFDQPHARQMGTGLELSGRHRDGHEFPIEVSLSPVEVHGRRYAAAFVRDASERQRAVSRLQAVNEITQRLLRGSSVDQIFSMVAERGRSLSHSDAVWVVLPNDEGELEITSADGRGTEVLLGDRLSAETSRSAEALRSGKLEILKDLSSSSNVPARADELDLGAALYAPLISQEQRIGVIVFARRRGAPAYQDVEIAFIQAFAGAVAATVELGHARASLEQLRVVAEDERIARDLHDTVIQQIFAIGMSIQSLRTQAQGELGRRLDTIVDSLDDVIKEIRNTIFRLPGSGTAGGVRERLLEVCEHYRPQLGFTPRIAFDGPVDLSVEHEMLQELTQVVGEGLSNIARHAKASSAEVILTVNDGWITLHLVDNGVGVDSEPTAGNGLRNIAVRAERLKGSASVAPRQSGGTILEWRVPL